MKYVTMQPESLVFSPHFQMNPYLDVFLKAVLHIFSAKTAEQISLGTYAQVTTAAQKESAQGRENAE